jgi:hypothetical protein
VRFDIPTNVNINEEGRDGCGLIGFGEEEEGRRRKTQSISGGRWPAGERKHYISQFVCDRTCLPKKEMPEKES